MDEQVRLAMAKWPNVPHCYGWLGLDARGAWRMRDQHAQQVGLLGSKISNVALRDFINRNYQADEQGRYFFQNGPQRVYVELESTPYIAHSDPELGWVLHTGAVLTQCDAVWMIEEGGLVFCSGNVLAKIDDRDMVDAMQCVYVDGKLISDQQMLDWISGRLQVELTFLFQQRAVPIAKMGLEGLARIHPFVTHPQPQP